VTIGFCGFAPVVCIKWEQVYVLQFSLQCVAVSEIITLIYLFQCQATNEEEIFEVQDKGSLLSLGWIHVS
jgi:hypothetical protein